MNGVCFKSIKHQYEISLCSNFIELISIELFIRFFKILCDKKSVLLEVIIEPFALKFYIGFIDTLVIQKVFICYLR